MSREAVEYYKAVEFFRRVDKHSEHVQKNNNSKFVNLTSAMPFQEPPRELVVSLSTQLLSGLSHNVNHQNTREIGLEHYNRLLKGTPFSDSSSREIHLRTSVVETVQMIFQHERSIAESSKRKENLQNKRGSYNSPTPIFPNKKVLLPTPTFGYYLEKINPDDEDNYYDIQYCFADKSRGYRLDISALREVVEKQKPGVLLLVHPVNPTGIAYTEQELQKIANICIEHNVFVISDEVFADIFTKQNKKIPTMAQFMPPEKLFVVNGTSKSYGCPGARIAWLVGDSSHTKHFMTALTGTVGTLNAKVAEFVLEQKNEKIIAQYQESNKKLFVDNLQVIHQKLDQINIALSINFDDKTTQNYIELLAPEATSVALLDFSRLSGKNFLGRKNVTSGLDIAEALLNSANFALAPGEASMIPPEDMMCCIAFHDKALLEKGFDNVLEAIKAKKVEAPRLNPQKNAERTTSPTQVRIVESAEHAGTKALN